MSDSGFPRLDAYLVLVDLVLPRLLPIALWLVSITQRVVHVPFVY